MAHIGASVKLLHGNRLDSIILKEVVKELNKILGKNLNKIKQEIQLAIRGALLIQPEVYSLLNRGKLQAEFGIRDSRDAITEIIDFWISNIIVKKTPVRVGPNGIIKSNIKIDMIKADYHDVTSLPAANVLTDKGVTLPWLEWLLTFGDRYIVRDYTVSYAVGSFRLANSRSGLAIMVPAPRHQWRVPPEFAGTQNNNFVTRAIDSIDSKLEGILQKIFE